MRRLAIGLVLMAWVAGFAPVARAHDSGTTAYAAIIIDGSMLRYTLTLSSMPSSPLAREMGFGQPGRKIAYGLLADAVATKLHFRNNGEACAAGPRSVGVPNPTSASISATVDFVCPGAIERLTIRDDLFDVLGQDLHSLARIDWSGGTTQFAFGPDARETTVSVKQTGAASRSGGAGSFLMLGVEHILTGYDHLLFLLMLVICGGGVWQILKIITAFTVAHSVTLALAALNIVVLPGRLVETAIALSIAFVATENLLPHHSLSHRWMVSFLFGAVHGFGFSNVLREAGLTGENLVWSLLSFNLGVEVGQAAAVLAIAPLLYWLGESRWKPTAVAGISAVVLAFSLYLSVDRLIA